MKQLCGKKKIMELLDVESRRLQTWRVNKVIPFIKVGKRTILYDPDAVLAALEKYERKPRAKGKKLVREVGGMNAHGSHSVITNPRV
jgi:hypothetical protein